MTYLILVIVAVLLFAGFLALTAYEARRGSRLFAGTRYRLDSKVARMFFVFEHVDWGAFSAHLTRTTATTLAHDIAHGTLVAVRAVERFLTRAVRALRSHRDNAAVLPEPVAPNEVPAVATTAVEIPVEAPVLPPIAEAKPAKKERVKQIVVSVEPAEAVQITEIAEEHHPVPAEATMARPAPRRSMDIPRRTKSKGHDIVQGPKEDTPV